VPAAALAAFVSGCSYPTNVSGRLSLNPGDTGDARLARIELHDSLGWKTPALYAVTADPTSQAAASRFLFPEVKAGTYFLVAWQDRDGDGVIGDGEVAGVNGGPYNPGWFGNQVVVPQSWTVDVGEITLYTYRRLVFAMSGARVQSGTATSSTRST
jgi:uncharacterized protein (DUF2141 family)